jgi:predicted PurR-regulated permease PerM
MTDKFNSKMIFHRLLGALIIYRTIAPVIVIIMLAFILYYIPSEINRIGNETVDKIEDEHLAPLKSSIKDMQNEVNRLKGEVQKAKKAVEGVNAEFKRVLSPVYAAISALYVAQRELQNSTRNIIYKIIDAINVIPKINIKKPRFPPIRIDLPRLDLTPFKIDIKPDLSSLKEIKRISKAVGAELNNSAKTAGKVFSFGWKWIKVIIVLFTIWLLAVCVTVAEGMWRNVSRGWKMLAGGEVEPNS